MNPAEQRLAELVAAAARTSDAAHWPEAVAIAILARYELKERPEKSNTT